MASLAIPSIDDVVRLPCLLVSLPTVVCPNLVTVYNGLVLIGCVGSVLLLVFELLGGDTVKGTVVLTLGVGVNTYCDGKNNGGGISTCGCDTNG